jgi:4-amino-4-deoxy-L-arabinose transferase-like glycosyltransferase
MLGRDEGRFAQAAREMAHAGELIVPTFGGRDRYDKPILIYWCVIASYELLGVSPGSARLPSNVAAALTVGLLAWWARRRWGPGAGVVAGLIMAVTPTFHLQARACTADQVMVLPTVAALLALAALWRGSGGPWPRTVLWVGLALAVLAKGPVAPMMLVATGVGLWVLGRPWPRWQLATLVAVLLVGVWVGPWVLVVPGVWALAELPGRLDLRRLLSATGWWWGVPLLLVLTLPWAVAAWRATDGAFFAEAVGRHVVARSLTALESHGGFPGFYPLTATAVAFPLLAFALAAASGRWRQLRSSTDGQLLLAWWLAPLVVLELLGTKLVHYWLPAYPAAALVVAEWWARDSFRQRSRWWALLGLGAVLLAAVPMVVASHLGLDDLLVPAAGVAVLLIVPTALACWRWWRNGARSALPWAVGGSGIFVVALLAWFLPLLAPKLLPVRVAEAVAEHRLEGELIVVYELRDDELLFQLPMDAKVCRTEACLEALLSARTNLLGVARACDLRALRGDEPVAALTEVTTVRGVELGRGRWSESVLFRPARDPAP